MRFKSFWLSGLLLVLTLQSAVRAASVSDFANFSLTINFPIIFGGRLYVPPEAASGPRPLILFMHGAGETGFDNRKQVNSNIDNLLAEAKQRGAFLYAPQTFNNWANADVLGWMDQMLDRAIDQYNVDPSRIYVTGLSLGGGGVWNLINRYPDRFAAAVPICGVEPTGFQPANLTDQAVWAFHARNDPTVSVTTTRNRVNEILTASGDSPLTFPPISNTTALVQFDSATAPDLHYTEYPTGGHGIWSSVFAYEPMYDWMFSHSVPEPSAAVSLTLGAGLLAVFRYRQKRKARQAATTRD